MELFKPDLFFKPIDSVHISMYRRGSLDNIILHGVKLITFECLFVNLLIGLYDSGILSEYSIKIDKNIIDKLKQFIEHRKNPMDKRSPEYEELKYWITNIHRKELDVYKFKLYNLYGQCVNIIHNKIKEYNGDDSTLIIDTDEIYVNDDIDFNFIDSLGIPYKIEYIDAMIYKDSSYIKIYDDNIKVNGTSFNGKREEIINEMKKQIRNNNIDKILK